MRKVHILTYDGAILLDVAAPLQTLRMVSLYLTHRGEAPFPYYETTLTSVGADHAMTTVGVALQTTKARPHPIDTLLIAGGSDDAIAAANANPELISYVRAQASLARRVASLSTGAFILAKAQLLNGRRAATHWMDSDALAKDFPAVKIVADAAYVIDGKYWTAAGSVSGVDLALAMVEQDLGRRVADFAARVLVADVRRAPGEPQVSVRAEAGELELGRIKKLMQWIMDNPKGDLTTVALAKRANLSVRSLHRHFTAQTSDTPAKFVERARVQTAQRLLVKTDEGLEGIAASAGFKSVSSMQRAFRRVVRTTPFSYRRRMRSV